MTLEETVKKIRVELSEAVTMQKAGNEMIANACLGHVGTLVERYLAPKRRYKGDTREVPSLKN